MYFAPFNGQTQKIDRTCKTCGNVFHASEANNKPVYLNGVGESWYCDEHVEVAKATQAEELAAWEAKRQKDIQEREAKLAADKAIRAERIAKAEQSNLDNFEKLSRHQQNDILRSHGYKWTKDYSDDPDDREFVWVLMAADGRVVSVARAIDEIRRGVEVVAAEYAAKQAAAEQQAAAEAEAAYEKATAHQAQNDAAYAAFDAEAKRLTDGMVQVQRFPYWNEAENVQTVYKMQPLAAGTISRRYDYIQSMTVKGVSVIVTITGSGYDDDGYSSIYCADPAAAGLTPYTPSDLDRRFDLFFG